MTKNFKVRLSVSLILLAMAAVFVFTFESVPFKIFFGSFATVSAIELLSFFKKKINLWTILLALLEIAFLITSSIFVARLNALEMVLLIFGVCGYDVFAYLFGNWLGASIFKKSRPFPHISKNKTWEGTIMGLVTSFVLTGLIMIIWNSTEYLFLLCGPLALIGDLIESFSKRRFGIKDSNEIVIKNKLFAKAELLVGGSEGHGGYLDRIDSMAFTATILLLISLI